MPDRRLPARITRATPRRTPPRESFTPVLRKWCPVCRARPSRDQRDSVQDGRCVPCGDLARSRPDAAPRKTRKAVEQAEQPWAYV